MAGQETPLSQKLREYVDTVRDTAGPEERRLQFLDLVRTVLGLPLSNFELQNEMYGGRMYALLGNLVLEVKANLPWRPKEAQLQLEEYITELNSRRPQSNYIAIATDGLHFPIYTPRYDETGRVVELEKIHGLNLVSPMMTLEQATHDLGVVLSYPHQGLYQFCLKAASKSWVIP